MVGTAPTSEIVLKPVDGRASRGVTFHRSAVELQTWLDAHPGEVEGYLAEERKLGREFSVESLIVRSGDAWHGVTAKTTIGAVESGHLHPAPLEASERTRIVDAATACLEALGIDRGMLHTEVILDDAGAAHVVETHLRGGGDKILDLVRSATGLDLTELYVQDVLEGLDEIPAATNLGFASSQFVFPVELGVISGWDGVEEARAMPGVDRRDHPPKRGRPSVAAGQFQLWKVRVRACPCGRPDGGVQTGPRRCVDAEADTGVRVMVLRSRCFRGGPVHACSLGRCCSTSRRAASPSRSGRRYSSGRDQFRHSPASS